MAEAPAGAETVSPKNRVKFLCSHGGKILPRPADGQLKYIGGETRIIAVPRDINFQELMQKLRSLGDGDMVLKYRLIPEDLDVLVSVTCDEDLRHMLDEYDRHDHTKSSEGNTGSPRLRAFLFPSNPVVVDTQMAAMDSHALEQRYIDAINGFVRNPGNVRLSSCGGIGRPSFSISSTCSSPKSAATPDGYSMEAMNHEDFSSGFHRVHSSPSLCSLSHLHYYHHYHHHHHHHNNHQSQQLQHHLYSSSRLHSHGNGGNGRLASALSLGRSDIGNGRIPVNFPPIVTRYHSSTRHHGHGGNGGCVNCVHADECGNFCGRGRGLDVVDSHPQAHETHWLHLANMGGN